MSRIVIPNVAAGDDISVASINTALANWRTQSTAINAQNVAEGGVDRRNIAPGAVTEQPTGSDVYTTSSASTASYSGLAQVQIASANVEVGPFTYNSGSTSKLEVVCSFQYAGAVNGTAASPVEHRYALQLYYSVGGSPVAIGSTLRKVSFEFWDAAIKGSMTIRHLFSVSTGSVSNLKFHLYAGELAAGGANLTIENVCLYARMYHC